MNNQKDDKLIAEYNANVELWKHDDSLRQHRQSNFLTVNTILLVGLGAVIGLKPPIQNLAIVSLVFSIFGLFLSAIWHKVQVRNAEYVRFRRLQLLHIESKLGSMDTFTNTYRAFYKNKDIDFGGDVDQFVLSNQAKRRSTLSEGRLPILLGVFWGVMAVVSIYLVLVYE